MQNTVFSFIGGDNGQWKVSDLKPVVGDSLERVSYVKVEPFSTAKQDPGVWTLRGVKSNLRYTEKHEEAVLSAVQPGLNRKEASCAALIPIRKTTEWWRMAQDERRKIFELQSGHIRTGLTYLPAIARSLYHSRDLGESFDFLTWFEYAPADSDAFEELVRTLRTTEEWKYVEREVDIRLVKQ